MPLDPTLAALFDEDVVPRLPELAPDEWDPEAAEAIRLASVVVPAGYPVPAMFATLAAHPRLYAKWNLFAGRLLKGELPPADRELVIVRTLWHTRSRYEWAAHCALAHAAGVDNDVLRQLTLREPDRLGDREAALVAVVDSLHETSDVDDDRWAAMEAHLDGQQIIEVLMLVGQYHLVAYVTNALRFRPEEGVAAAIAAHDGDIGHLGRDGRTS